MYVADNSRPARLPIWETPLGRHRCAIQVTIVESSYDPGTVAANQGHLLFGTGRIRRWNRHIRVYLRPAAHGSHHADNQHRTSRQAYRLRGA